MKIMIVGGTGFLGYHALLVALKRGYPVRTLAIDDISLESWYPGEVDVRYGNVFELSEKDLQEHFSGCDAIVYAVGPDDRVTPPAPAYDFFHTRLVVSCEKTIIAARKAGIKLVGPKTAFLIQGLDRVGAIADIANKLGKAHIGITAMDAIATGRRRYGVILWVKPANVAQVAKILGAS